MTSTDCCMAGVLVILVFLARLTSVRFKLWIFVFYLQRVSSPASLLFFSGYQIWLRLLNTSSDTSFISEADLCFVSMTLCPCDFLVVVDPGFSKLLTWNYVSLWLFVSNIIPIYSPISVSNISNIDLLPRSEISLFIKPVSTIITTGEAIKPNFIYKIPISGYVHLAVLRSWDRKKSTYLMHLFVSHLSFHYTEITTGPIEVFLVLMDRSWFMGLALQIIVDLVLLFEATKSLYLNPTSLHWVNKFHRLLGSSGFREAPPLCSHSAQASTHSVVTSKTRSTSSQFWKLVSRFISAEAFCYFGDKVASNMWVEAHAAFKKLDKEEIIFSISNV